MKAKATTGSKHTSNRTVLYAGIGQFLLAGFTFLLAVLFLSNSITLSVLTLWYVIFGILLMIFCFPKQYHKRKTLVNVTFVIATITLVALFIAARILFLSAILLGWLVFMVVVG